MKSLITLILTQGKYGRCLYCDHVTKCFVSKCVIQVAMYCYDHEFKLGDKHQLAAKLYRRYLDDTFKDKAFQSHDHNTGGDHTCPVIR